jgi:predicted Holliday junction resolvase-like endonuclease
MSTAVVIIIVIAILIILAIVLVPRLRARKQERQLERRRGEVAEAHRDEAGARATRAREAEQIAARERAEAELHEARADLHERGMADDELDRDREHLGVDDDRDAGARSERDVPPARGEAPPGEHSAPR